MDITDKVILIRPAHLYRDGMPPDELYEATRGVWKVNVDHASEALYALVVGNGVVVEVYEIDRWERAGTSPYRYRPAKEVNRPGRWEFAGQRACGTQRRYVGMSVGLLFPKGAQTPIRYINC